MYLCIDIGGTKTLIALFSRRGRVVRRKKFKTAKLAGDFIKELSRALRSFAKYDVSGVVVAIPGVVKEVGGSRSGVSDGFLVGSGDFEDRVSDGSGVSTPDNLGSEQIIYSIEFGNRDWGNIDILTPIKKLFNCPVWFENDANLASLYEGYRLPGKTVFLTFSTGIGGGVVEHNRILAESNGFEPGHWVYTYKGETAEWEDLAASSALERVFKVKYATNIRGKARLTEVAERVALGLPRVIDEYEPRTIILGGPLGKIFKLYAKYLPPEMRKKCRRPKRPTESVIYGEYLYAKQKERE